MTGPIDFAIDGKDETAWGIDTGPGRRNQPRKAVFIAEKPVSFPPGLLTFYLSRIMAAGTATTTRTAISAAFASP